MQFNPHFSFDAHCSAKKYSSDALIRIYQSSELGALIALQQNQNIQHTQCALSYEGTFKYTRPLIYLVIVPRNNSVNFGEKSKVTQQGKNALMSRNKAMVWQLILPRPPARFFTSTCRFENGSLMQFRNAIKFKLQLKEDDAYKKK